MARYQSEDLSDCFRSYQARHQQRQISLSFGEFLRLVRQDPRRFTRHSAQYLFDTFQHFGSRDDPSSDLVREIRYTVFDRGSDRNGPIIGGEDVQFDIMQGIDKFCRTGRSDRVILLHGPNGSAKSSTVEAITRGMEDYSYSDEGAVYRFNWIFPADREAVLRGAESGPIGFAGGDSGEGGADSFAHYEDRKIAAKLTSEFKENPLFLLPMPHRENLLRGWIGEQEGIPPEEVMIPPHIRLQGLSKRNQEVFECLLNAYDGDLHLTLRHVQVERFFFSRKYRVGISSVQPQLSIDAGESQLTLNRNYSQLPAILQTISFFQSAGPLVEANRGLLEFSDLLKRPVDAFKYLLNTVESGTINLNSGTADLDTVFVATTNEKHLDAFKTMPDFSSFRGRFEMITVPYLLLPELEEQIYRSDVEALNKYKRVSPHAVQLLSTWAVLTRLKQPDPESFAKEYRPLISRLGPRSKIRLYAKESMQPEFTTAEQAALEEVRQNLWDESRGTVVYEGRFGASPREVRSILHRAAQNGEHQEITPMAIFDELRYINKNRTVYEFLQFEPRGRYHDTSYFVDCLIEEFLDLFETEAMAAMAIADDTEYSQLLQRYVDHVVAYIKKEKIWDEATNSYITPSVKIMEDVEDILGITEGRDEHRQSLLSRIAATKLENPDRDIEVVGVFQDYLDAIKRNVYEQQKEQIHQIFRVMVAIEKGESAIYAAREIELAEATFADLEARFGYSRQAAYDSLRFLFKKRLQAAPREEN